MKQLLFETIEFTRLALILAALLVMGIAGISGYGIGRDNRQQPVEEELHMNTPGYAIANFGSVPLNQDWLIIAHKSGQPIDRIPDPEQTVATSAAEPVVERVDPATAWDRTIWRITFRP